MLKCCSCSYICCRAYCRYQGRGSTASSFLQLKQLSSEIYRSDAIAFAYVTSSQDLQCCSCASICSVPGSIADLQHSSVPRSIAGLMWLLPSAPASVAVLDVSLTGSSWNSVPTRASSAATAPHLLQRLQSAQFIGLSQAANAANRRPPMLLMLRHLLAIADLQ